MSKFLVCLMLLALIRTLNQGFASSHADAFMVVVAIAFIVDLVRAAYHLSRWNN